jgi:ABC-type bacteriocin/lantibiotic exporter with double-glycine peptidase domain
MEEINITWNNLLPVVIYAIIFHFLIPTLKSIIPENQQAKHKKDALITQAAIAADERAAQLEDREVAALENISLTLVASNERLTTIESAQTKILSALQGQTNALAVLVDRVTPRRTPKK